MAESRLVRLTGLWRKDGKDGKPYLSGSVSPTSTLLVMANTDKRDGREPDFIAYIAPNERPADREPKPKSPAERALDIFGPPAIKRDADG